MHALSAPSSHEVPRLQIRSMMKTYVNIERSMNIFVVVWSGGAAQPSSFFQGAKDILSREEAEEKTDKASAAAQRSAQLKEQAVAFAVLRS